MKCFELAERLGGMTAYELMDRMSLPEMLEWIEYDQCHHDPEDYRQSLLFTKIDAMMWRRGQPKPDHKRYLKDIKVRKRATNIQEVRQRLDLSLGYASMETFGLTENNGRQL